MAVEISVVVCTYNRPKMLVRALESIIQQSINPNRYEIIVVNNASTDNTKKIVTEFQSIHNDNNIQLIHERRQGLGHARNTGLRMANGYFIAFIDDDACANPNWLKQALNIFEKVQPTPIVVGGPIFPLYEAPKPSWFEDRYEIRTWGQKSRYLLKGESFSGSNMIFQRDVFTKYGCFNTQLGVRGEYLSMGEETSLFEIIWQRIGYKCILYYSPDMKVLHSVPANNMTVKYRLKRAFAGGQSSILQKGHDSNQGLQVWLINDMMFVIKHTLLALKHHREYPTHQNWMFERISPIAIKLGRIMGCLGFYVNVRQR